MSNTNNATMNTKEKTARESKMSVRYITVTAMLSAIAFVLMFLDFSVPVMPGFIKMDLSELPALIGAFAMGPACGVMVCLIKNLLHLLMTSTGGVGELSNFVLGVAFVLPAGLIYKAKKTRKNAIIGSLVGAVAMAIVSFPSNLFVVYPIYENFMPRDVIIAAYQAIVPSVETLWQCLLLFNVPFTFVKALASVLITMLVYKKLSPVLKGTSN
ncbi:MAG: ECF transporter S component [Lachnospiraceae bacterium]|nr:ECF transporter S component [Lachnospiraceae bacterium]